MGVAARRVFIVVLGIGFWPAPVMPADGAGSARALEYLYVDANVGGSSGGHVALNLDGSIYHFQFFPDGLFRIVRDTWTHFRYIYNDLENRTIGTATVPVSAEAYDRVKDRFARLYLIQNAHLNLLQGLEKDIRLLESLRHGKPSLALRGAGLFSAERGGDYRALRLRAKIRRRKGSDFLTAELRRVDQELGAYAVELPDLSGVRVSPEELPRVAATASQGYLERSLLREALAVLEYARPLRSAAIMDPARCGVRAREAGLSQRERRLLLAYRARLEKSVLGLLDSHRPDRGFPLLLATARHQLVQRSLEVDRLLVLEPFSPDAVTIPATTVSKKGALMERLAARARRTLADVRREVFAPSNLDETGYNRLENSAGRYYEIQRGMSEHRAVRVERRRLIPARPRFVAASSPRLAPLTLQAKQAVARDNFDRYRRQVSEAYGFGLITRNCATELVRSINGAFPNSAERIDELGGSLSPGEALSFIPFRLYDVVQERLRVAESAILPSYRKRRLAQIYGQENSIAAYLREFNTLSSTIYRPSDDDGAFLLFTDDVLWPRPLYGIVNLAYGLVTAGVGAISWPVEGDSRIKAGFRGAFFSLPELVFANIRKGSFEFVSDGATARGVLEPDVQEATFHRRVAP